MRSRSQRMAGQALVALFGLAACVAAIGQVRAGSAADATAASELRRGQILWLQCAACHDLVNRARPDAAEGTLGKIGPHLQGVLGRRAGSLPGFPYSNEMRNSGLTWSNETLDEWLRDPAAVVPGTLMVFPGIAGVSDRRALLRYLEQATRGGAAPQPGAAAGN